jgi:hypothetical protein
MWKGKKQLNISENDGEPIIKIDNIKTFKRMNEA